jgi:hypothetical protein
MCAHSAASGSSESSNSSIGLTKLFSSLLPLFFGVVALLEDDILLLLLLWGALARGGRPPRGHPARGRRRGLATHVCAGVYDAEGGRPQRRSRVTFHQSLFGLFFFVLLFYWPAELAPHFVLGTGACKFGGGGHSSSSSSVVTRHLRCR